MTTYQGPHASVTQQFVTSPGAVAIEDLPPTIVATAFDVFSKEQIGTHYGIIDNELAWGADSVVYDKDVIDQRALDFYPPAVFANGALGQVDLEIDDSNLSSDGATISLDKDYSVPNVARAKGVSQAIIPYYKVTKTVKILATDLDTVIITDGAVVTAQIKPGQKVFINDGGWVEVGTVGSIGTDETKVNLASPYSGAIAAGTDIAIGAVSTTNLDRPNTLYDATADFIADKVQIGDIVYISSLTIAGSETTPKVASVVSIVDKNTLKFNTDALAPGSVDLTFSQYKTFAEAPGSTIAVSIYDIKRLAGFSENYGLKALNGGGGVPIGTVTGNVSFTIPDTVGASTVPALAENDIFILTNANVAAGTDERGVFSATRKLYRVKTISYDGSDYTITVDSTLYISDDGTTEAALGDFITAWTPKIETPVLGDFRAIRSEEAGVVKRITSTEDIFTAWVRDGEESIDPRNELAFMMNAAFLTSGGKVCYGVNVDASASNLSTEYGNALEELKLIDCYSHAFGTTDAGVNAIIAPYCNGQAEPYEGHERTGIVSYDQEDIFLMGVDTGTNDSSGVITLAGAFNPLTAGVTVSDTVDIYDSAGDFQETVTVTETPTVVTTVQTDGETAYGATHTYRFKSGRKQDQAIRIGALGIDERRVTIIWPGWFYADFGDDRLLLPPYFIAATIAGQDSGIIASQSFTNLPFGIPGLSNIQLDTATNYRKTQLDEMGGGGVDVLIQDSSITQTIKSRHDLTSNNDSVQFRERSITKQADVSAKAIRAAIAPYVGRYNITDDLFKFLGQVCSIVSTRLVKDGIIAALSVDKIERDEVIDDKINFFMTATAFVAGNYYDVTLLVQTR